MKPQTGRRLRPNESQGIKQDIRLTGVEPGKGGMVKMRWKLTYKVGSETRHEDGMVPALGIS
jgi:ADP-ribosylation factor-binding protein GGA